MSIPTGFDATLMCNQGLWCSALWGFAQCQWFLCFLRNVSDSASSVCKVGNHLSTEVASYSRGLETHTVTHSHRAMRCNYCLGALAELRKATISFVMSVGPYRTIRFQLDGFSQNLIFECFFPRKSVEKIQVSLKSDNNIWYFTWRPVHIFNNISLNSSEIEKYFRHNSYRNSKHIFNNSPPPQKKKSYNLWDDVKEYVKARDVTNNNATHAHCMLDNRRLQTHTQNT